MRKKKKRDNYFLEQSSFSFILTKKLKVQLTIFNERILKSFDGIGHFQNSWQVHERFWNGVDANYEKENTIIETWIQHRFQSGES